MCGRRRRRGKGGDRRLVVLRSLCFFYCTGVCGSIVSRSAEFVFWIIIAPRFVREATTIRTLRNKTITILNHYCCCGHDASREVGVFVFAYSYHLWVMDDSKDHYVCVDCSQLCRRLAHLAVCARPSSAPGMGADHFVCVESAKVEGGKLNAGETWTGKMKLLPA